MKKCLMVIMLLLSGIYHSMANAEVQELSGSDASLTLEYVLSSSADQFPAILESLARRRAAEGEVVAADGAFDLVFSADGFDRVTGFWTGRVVNTQVKRRLRPLGATVYGGYRVSDGTFPIYEDINFTNTGGEAKIGAIFSLLRDRTIDPQRFKTTDARLALEQAEFEVLLTKVGVQRQAVIAYWQWVSAGQQLRVYEELLNIAESREEGLAEQIRQGAIAEIFLTENRQNITRRQRLVLQAQRDFQAAANNLSFYYRDRQGTPILPQPSQLPNIEEASQTTAEINIEQSISNALANRPELSILRTALQRAENKTALGRNALRARFDVNAEVSHDFGNVAEGGISRDSTDTIVGFRFSVPLQRREAKGRLRAAQAKVEATRQRRRLAMERIELEIRNVLIDLNTSTDLARIAVLEVEQSEIMEEAERTRFASGASDFFLVNVREETTADARIRHILALLQNNIAAANYDAATVNLQSLGLSDHDV